MLLFEWDEAKAQSNLQKHGVSFDLAISVFADDFVLTEQDRIATGELRWRTIGLAMGIKVLFVAHTWEERNEDDVVRIIFARRATPKERRQYEQNRQTYVG
jgi:uncharacterized DUF497 family protein